MPAIELVTLAAVTKASLATKVAVAGAVVAVGATIAHARAGVKNGVEQGLTNAEFSTLPYRHQMAFVKMWVTNDEYDTMVRTCVDKKTIMEAGVTRIDGVEQVVCCMPMCKSTKNPVICVNGHGMCQGCDETSILWRVMSVFDRQYTENIVPAEGLARTSLRAIWILIRNGLGKGDEHDNDDPKCPICRGRYLERHGRPRVAVAQEETNDTDNDLDGY
jgi:hypothetical protein